MMDISLIAFMLGISIMLGLFGLLFFIWGLKGGQFDDEKKMMQGLLFDDEDELNYSLRDRTSPKKKEDGAKKE